MAAMLREQIEADIGNVFLNPDDFAETIALDGMPMSGVIEEIAPAATIRGQKFEGTFARSLYIFVKSLSVPPTTRRRVVLSRAGADERWTVEEIIETNGMMRIRLKAVDS